jgi:hypothetical protein
MVPARELCAYRKNMTVSDPIGQPRLEKILKPFHLLIALAAVEILDSLDLWLMNGGIAHRW